MLEALLEVAIDLTSNLSARDRFQRLLDAVTKVTPCDACAILKFEGGVLVPIAVEGLSPDTLGRRFDPVQHPRFKQIMNSKRAVRFPSDSPLPDPYDGLMLHHEGELEVHACMGCSLHVNNHLLGILTLDGLKPGMFEQVDDQTVEVFSALAAAAMQTALLIDELEKQAKHKSLLAQELVSEALMRDGGEIIGQSKAMETLYEEIKVVAESDLTVLITGETGVGKELVARTIHSRSPRADQPLVHINCAALPESVAESELFGHTKGAFTGAVSSRGGKFELAHGGTLFLDEIGELPITIQAKMLRALQSGEIQRVGSDKVQQVDVRVIAATNRNLKDEVLAGHFRRDLYHRLSVFPMEVPPLRERTGDISILAGYFLEKTRIKLGLTTLRISSNLLSQMENYNWPGNVRELEHVISRASLRARAQQLRNQQQTTVVTIEPNHCNIEIETTTDSMSNVEREAKNSDRSPPTTSAETLLVFSIDQQSTLADALNNFQSTVITKRLETHNNNWSKTADSLGVDRGNLHRMAKRLGLK